MPPKTNKACQECGHSIADHEDGTGCLNLHNDDRNNYKINILAKRVCSCMQTFTSTQRKQALVKRVIPIGPKRKLWEILPDVRAL